jgi:hypothetical protein
MTIKGDNKKLSSFSTYKNIKFSISDNYNIKNIPTLGSNLILKNKLNNNQNNIIAFTEEMTKNLFLNSIKITKIKNKYKSTNYNFFEYFHQNHFEPINSKNSYLRQSNLIKKINNNFLFTSYFCNDARKTKILIEFLKLDFEHDLFSYYSNKEDYSYLKNFENFKENEKENFSSSLDSLNINLIFDITFVDPKKRNFSNCKIIDNFIILITQDEIMLLPLSDIMLLNVNLNCFSFNFYKNFNNENKLFFLNKNLREIPQAYNWPIINGLKPILKIKQENKEFCIEKSFVFLYYNSNKKTFLFLFFLI